VGLINDEAWADFQQKQERLKQMRTLLEKTRLTSAMAKEIQTTGADFAPPEAEPSAWVGQTLVQLLKRPEVVIERLVPALRDQAPEFFARGESIGSRLPVEIRNELKSVETEIKYEGYLQQQQRAIDRLKKAEQRMIPEWFDYGSVSGLSKEMQETLLKVRPRTLAHASRIPGVTPAAVSLVNVFIEIQGKRREQAAAL
jgi:tRNA uridine 5-carboxymethylaminomethyl modification enzyme